MLCERGEEKDRRRRRGETFQVFNLRCYTDLIAYQFPYICFYFIGGPGDTVECYACGVRISTWGPGDMPQLRHRQHAPACPLLETLTEEENDAASVVSGATSGIGSMASGRSGMTAISSATSRSSDSGLGDLHNFPAVMGATALPT